MKYILVFLIILSFIGPVADKNKSTSSVIRDGVYNYITCLENTRIYLVENVPAFSKLADIPYEKAYREVMEDKRLEKHLVSSGETIDSIIKSYNSDVEDLENYRKIIYKENPGIVSSSYEIKSGEYIVVPSD